MIVLFSFIRSRIGVIFCSLAVFFLVTACGESVANGTSSSNDGEPVSEVVSGNGSAPKPPSNQDPSTPPPSSSEQTMQQQVLALTNSYRAQYGLGPLAWNAQLAQAAQVFAQLMADEGFFSHNSPDGTTPGQRITQAGYRWRTWGENIAWGYSTAEAVMQGWINSSGHRANILNTNFKEIGVGYARGASAYWVQDFGVQ